MDTGTILLSIFCAVDFGVIVLLARHIKRLQVLLKEANNITDKALEIATEANDTTRELVDSIWPTEEEGQGAAAWIVILALIVVALVILGCCLSQGAG